MAGKTISAYTDEETSARVDQIARLENRKKAQIVGTALKFYVGLTPEVRAVWQEVEAIGSCQIQTCTSESVEAHEVREVSWLRSGELPSQVD